MTQTLKTLLKLSAAAVSLSFVVGCATQASSDMQAQLEETTRLAEQANTTAQQADDKADTALSRASAAMDMAEEAEALARSAQSTADDNSEKIDRMFERSMYK